MNEDTPDPVGYRRPPTHTRFRPGQSGNPSGRPKRRPTFCDDLAAVLDEFVAPGDGCQEVTVTRQQAVVKKLVSTALEGNMKALSLVAVLSQQREPGEVSSPEPTAIDTEILSDYTGGDHAEMSAVALPKPLNEGEEE